MMVFSRKNVNFFPCILFLRYFNGYIMAILNESRAASKKKLELKKRHNPRSSYFMHPSFPAYPIRCGDFLTNTRTQKQKKKNVYSTRPSPLDGRRRADRPRDEGQCKAIQLRKKRYLFYNNEQRLTWRGQPPCCRRSRRAWTRRGRQPPPRRRRGACPRS